MTPAYSVDASADSVAYRGLMAKALLASFSPDRDWLAAGSPLTAQADISLSTSFPADVWGSTAVEDWLRTAMAAKSQRQLRVIIQSLRAAASPLLGVARESAGPWPEHGRSLAPPADREEDAFLSIAVAFPAAPQVKSIYVQRFRSDIQVFTVLAIQTYDDGLMDELLDREWQIRQAYPELFFDFVYPIGSEEGAPDFIHPAARCIFSR